MRNKEKELTWGQATWRFMAIFIAMFIATLLPGDSVNGNVLGTVVLIVALGIPTAILAYRTEIRSG